MPDASIDTLTSIPQEILAQSAPGRVYAKQIAATHATNRYEFLCEQFADPQNRLVVPPVTDEAIEEAREAMEIAQDNAIDAQEDIGGIVFLPALDNLPKIEKKLKALNKKAEKLGTEPITLTKTDVTLVLNYAYDHDNHRAWHADFEHVFVIFTGATPKIEGYEFLARVTHTDAGNIVAKVNPFAYSIRHGLDRNHATAKLDSIDLSRYYTTGAICEQCGLDRDRLDTFIVYDEITGETRQIGRTCLRDYMGTNNPERVLKVLEQVWETLRSFGARSETPVITTREYMAHVAALIEAEGFTPRSAGMGTADFATENYFNLLRDERDPKTRLKVYITPEERHYTAADQVIDWAGSWEEYSDFANNVRVALANEVMNRKAMGFAAAAYKARERAESRRIQREQEREQQGVSEFIGAVKQRATFTLTVKQIKWIDDRYNGGTKPLYILADPDGNSVKWFASSAPFVSDQSHIDNPHPVEGQTYEVKATVQRHDESDRFGKSTVIARAKFEKTLLHV